MQKLVLISFAFICSQVLIAQTVIVPYGSSWKYLDNGSNPGTAWRTTSFSDAIWKSGNAQLGYGDGDEATVVSYGRNANKKYITTYFRKTLSIIDVAQFSNFTLNIKRDDGAIVYINGAEVMRTNMPTGIVDFKTKASTAASDDGNTAQSTTLATTQLQQGTNVLAVEVHQNAANSTDLSFDLQLIGNGGGGSTATLTRGPYMNLATQTGIIIRWRTNTATDSKVNYGTTAGSLTNSVTDNTLTTEHIVQLTGLAASTKYYYSIGSSSQTLQGDANNFFKTMPAQGSTQKVRILAMGDMGNNSTNQINVRNAYLNYNGNNHTDIWMLLGDNAYNDGLDNEYQTKFYEIYQGNLTKNHVLWPAPGNHDYGASPTAQADHLIPYYDMFSLPKNAEGGGVASNTEAFYSYNYGNIHFVSLDSYGWETGNTRLYDTTGPQVTWLKQDLAANTQPWIVVYFHHPPYTKGSHNSDTETELVNLRQRLVRILERYNVDLVLNGHSHSYERSYLINGHYDVESTFNAASHALSTSSAKYDNTGNSCPYIKNSTEVRNGIVFAIVGSAGQLGGSTAGYPHDAMHYSNVTTGGSMVLEIEGNRLVAKWVCSDGVVRDNFTIMKDVNKTSTIMTTPGSSITLTASWLGNYLWSTGATTRSITVAPSSNTTYSVSDNVSCLNDVFNVTVSGGSRTERNLNYQEIRIYPSIVAAGNFINILNNSKDLVSASVFDAKGRLMKVLKFSGNEKISTSSLKPGVYLVKFVRGQSSSTSKFIVE